MFRKNIVNINKYKQITKQIKLAFKFVKSKYVSVVRPQPRIPIVHHNLTTTNNVKKTVNTKIIKNIKNEQILIQNNKK